MSKDDLHELMARTSEWPDDAQNELKQCMRGIEARYYGVYITNKDEREALERSEDDVRSDRFAADEDVREVFRHFRRA